MNQRRPLSTPRAALALGFAAACLCACRADQGAERAGRAGRAAMAPGAGAAAAAAPARGKAASGHMTLGGDYRVDRDSLTTCALFPDKSFQVAFNTPQAPLVFLYIKGFAGAGTYGAEARVRANYSGETMRVSKAVMKAEIRVVPAAENSDLISGSFAGKYAGEGGQGTIAGRFESCRYPLPR